MFLKISQYSEENTCVGSLFNKDPGLGLQLYQKEIQHWCLPVNIAKLLTAAFLYKISLLAASEYKKLINVTNLVIDNWLLKIYETQGNKI